MSNYALGSTIHGDMNDRDVLKCMTMYHELVVRISCMYHDQVVIFLVRVPLVMFVFRLLKSTRKD